jgi:hypothetical protein
LIVNCMYTICRNAAKYAETMLGFLGSHPGIDLSLARIPDNGRYRLYAGEASREVFLISLLYHTIIDGVNYEDINYRKFFEF